VSENEFVTVKMAHKNESREELNRKLVIRLKLANGEPYGIQGRLDFADNQVDATTGTIAVWAIFDNPNAVLLPGQYVNVLVSADNARRLPVVPQSAIQQDSQGRYVFVVDASNRVEQRRIQTGPFVGTDWAVKTGLKAGERVIVQGVQKVRPGQVVEAVSAESASQG
jgi:RND family efflux transporter MFP subunit